MGINYWSMKGRLLCLKCKYSDSDFKWTSDNPDFAAQILSCSSSLSGVHNSSDTNTYLSHYWTSTVHQLVLERERLSVMPSMLCHHVQALLRPNLYIVWGDVTYVCLLNGQLGFLYKCCTYTFNSVNVNNKTEALAWLMSFSVSCQQNKTSNVVLNLKKWTTEWQSSIFCNNVIMRQDHPCWNESGLIEKLL